MKTLTPIFAWLLLLPLAGWEYLNQQWECLLVLFAALVLVPMGLRLLGLEQRRWYAVIAAALSVSYLLDTPGMNLSDVLALPYLLLALWLTLREAAALLMLKNIRLSDMVRVFALGYWATGAVWAVCFLAGFSPVGFDPVLVSLTAAHFHIAGFVLTVIVWCLLSDNPATTNRVLAIAVMAGMPMVATGITLTKLGFPAWFETVSALGFVAASSMVVVQLTRMFYDKKRPKNARILWLTGAVCLTAGAALAGLYALRFQYPYPWINIPNMKIWHGTLNALGFGWCTLSGWIRMMSDE